jgi:enoyl-[acyl-carrier protein] reductase I
MKGLMRGRRGLIMGVANDHSIAWGIAQKLAEHGAELAFTYQGEAFGKRVKPLAEKIGASLVLPCDVEDSASVAQVFSTLAGHWGKLDFLVHAIGFSDKNELKGLYADTSKENFIRTMVVSCYSFTEVTRHAAAIMPEGGSIITLTYAGSVRVMPNYNVMGVAKAALESTVRYLAAELGPKAIRVNAISAGPIKTLAASGIGGFSSILQVYRDRAPLRRNTETAEVADAAAFLLGPAGRGVTGEILLVDGGYSIVGL